MKQKRNKKKFCVYVHEKQLEEIKEKAKSAGFKTSDFIVRMTVQNEVKNRKDFDPSKYQAFLNTGNNLNQIAKSLNQKIEIDKDFEARIRKAVDDVSSILDELV